MRKVLGIALVAGVAVVGRADRAAPAPAVDTVLKMKVIAAAMEAEAGETDPYPGSPGVFQAVTALRAALAPERRSYLAAGKDAWGRPLLYWTGGRRMVLLSYGADGQPDRTYDPLAPWAGVPEGPTAPDPNADLLIVDGVVWRGPGSSKDRLRWAMVDLRAVGIAIESYSVDFSHYLAATDGVQPTDTAASELEPVYIKRLPRTDPWGNPYLIWSSPAEGYALVSYGSDGQPEYPYPTWTLPQWSTLYAPETPQIGRDLVFFTGGFVQWPAGVEVRP